MKFTIYQDSRRGTRSTNQDRIAYCYSRSALFMAVADGMGGYPRGEVAAEIAVQFMAAAFLREAVPSLADPIQFLRTVIRDAHHAIRSQSQQKRLAITPRTTCVVCIVQNGVAYWAHVGDSRLYHLRSGEIVHRTRDHSQVQQLVDTGRLREESVSSHPERNRIYSCLGGESLPRISLSHGARLQEQDLLLLCSDGLWSPVSNRLITSALAAPALERCVPELMDLALMRAGSAADNLSAVAMRWHR